MSHINRMVTGDLLIMALGFALCAWQSFATMLLWGWFIVPTFGLPAIGFVAAFGLHLVTDSFRGAPKMPRGDEERMERIGEVTAFGLLIPTTLIAFGWIVKHWI